MDQFMNFLPFVIFFILVLILKNKNLGDKFFAGNILKDYEVIDEAQNGISKVKHSLLLAEKDGVKRILIKEEVSAILGWSVRYFSFDMDSARKLRDGLNDTLKI